MEKSNSIAINIILVRNILLSRSLGNWGKVGKFGQNKVDEIVVEKWGKWNMLQVIGVKLHKLGNGGK